MSWKRQKIAVLAGGPSCEREISLISGKAVFDALKASGFSVSLVDPDPAGNFISHLKKEGVSAAFIALHGTFGEDGAVQRLLEEAGIAYTGAGPAASEAAFDKARTQTILKKAGVRVPVFLRAESATFRETLKLFEAPFVVKPSKAGSSVGVTILQDERGGEAACREALRFSDVILIEEYIKGRELTVGILGGEALPIVEVIAQRSFYDFEAKYRDSGTRYEFPAKLTPAEASVVSRAALHACRALGCEIMARVDLILDDRSQPFVLEANTIPGLTGKSLLPKAAQAAGIDFSALCVKILELSLNRNQVKTHGQAVEK